MNYGIYQGRGCDKFSGVRRPDSFLPKTAEWVDKILCLESENTQYEADKVLGGAEGIANAPLQALANRTQFLFNNLVKVVEILNAMNYALAPQMEAIKTMLCQLNQPTDYTHYSWLYLGNSNEAKQIYNNFAAEDTPDVILTLENGNSIRNPMFEIVLEGGKSIFVRTDGHINTIPPISDLDPEVLPQPD